MKSLRFAILFFIGTAIFACKKDKDNGTNTGASEPFIGKWVGAYGFDNDAPAIFFGLNIKADGEIQELNSSGVAKGKGTWIMQGGALKGTYKMLFTPYNEYSVLVTFNQSTGKIEGTWGYDKNGSDGGKVLLAKQ